MRSLRALPQILCLAVALSLCGCQIEVNSGDPGADLEAFQLGNQRTELILWGLAAIFWTWGNLWAVWAVTGRGYFVFRGIAALTPSLVLFWIGASDLIIFLVVQLFTIVGALTALRCARSIREKRASRTDASGRAPAAPSTFSVRDLLSSVLILALIFAIGANLQPKPDDDLRAMVVFGLCAAMTGLTSVYLVSGKQRLILRLGIAVLLISGTGAAVAFFNGGAWSWPKPLLVSPLWVPVIATALTSAALAGVKKGGAQRARLARVATLVLLAGMAIPAGAATWALAYFPPVPKAKPMQSNEFPKLVRLGESLPENFRFEEKNTSELRQFVNQHSDTLGEARHALKQPWQVQLDYVSFEQDMRGANALRRISFGFQTEARLAEMEKRFEDAVTIHLELILMGQDARRTPCWQYFIAGAGIELGGLVQLSSLRDKIEANVMMHALKRLRVSDDDYPNITDSRVQRAWFDRIASWREKLEDRIFGELVTNFTEGFEFTLKEIHLDRRTALRLLHCDLALRLYRKQKSAYPESLDDLVPDYLRVIPLDPYSENRFIYRPNNEADTFTLYSVGVNGRDENGKRQSRDQGLPDKPGDFLLDGLLPQAE